MSIELLHEGHSEDPIDMIDFNCYLDRLWLEEPRMAQIVELHSFGGLTYGEIADIIGVDERTVRRDWRVARAWLVGHMKRGRGNARQGLGAN